MKHLEFNHQSLSEILHALAEDGDNEIRIHFTDNSVLHNPESKKIVRSFAKSKGKIVHISHVSESESTLGIEEPSSEKAATPIALDGYEEDEVVGDEMVPDPQTQFLIDKDIATDEDLENLEDIPAQEDERRLEEVVSKADDSGSSASARLTQSTGPSLNPGLFIQRYKFHIVAVIVGSILLFGGGVGLLWYLPSADVQVTVSTKPIEREINITGVSGSNASTDSNQIALNKTEIKDTLAEEGKATGKKTVGEKAKGKATLRNYSVVNDATLAKGTVLKVLGGEGDGLEFITTDNVEVPHGSETSSIDDEGVLTESKKPGKIDVSVEAVELGKQYNLSSGTRFSVNNQSTKNLDAVTSGELTGGKSEEKVVVTEADQQTLLTSVTKKLESQGKDSLKQKIGAGQKLIDSSLKTEITKKDFNKKVDEEGPAVRLTGEAVTTGYYFVEDEAKQVLKSNLQKVVPEGYKLDETNITYNLLSSSSVSDNQVQIRGAVKATLIPNLDINTVRSRLVNLPLSDVESYFRKNESVSSVEVQIQPSYFQSLKKMPPRPEKINVNFVSK